MSILVKESLTPAEVATIQALARSEEDATGRSPLNEETRLHLTAGAGDFLHLLADYAYAGVSTAADPWVAEIAVGTGPAAAGFGPIIDRLRVLARGHGLAVWTHGRDSPTAEALGALGFRPARRLLTMERDLAGELPDAQLPEGYGVRPFVVHRDEAAWLAANAEAFARLPDQGNWTAADLAARMAEPWFDPAGFLLAEQAGQLAGFCWTKVDGPVGEIYVMAVLPAHQGRGLAMPLLMSGLTNLRRHTAVAELFVDADNGPAVRLYERAGFRTTDLDLLHLDT